MLNAIAGHDPRDPTTADRPVPDYRAALNDGIAGLRVGVIEEYMNETVDAECVAGAHAAASELERLGARVQTISFHDVTSFLGAATTILHAEGGLPREMADRASSGLRPAVLERLRVGSVLPAIDYVNAQRARRILVDRALEMMKDFDALICTTMPVVAAHAR